MKTTLSSNKEIGEDYKRQDTFNFITKANAIKSFLELSLDSLNDNKMIVLYGDWGSGKSSLMKHIELEIDKKIYYPIFFKAWEHEKDDNLALSLCDAITNSINKHNEVIKSFMKAALTTLKCFASGITLKAPGFLTGLGVDMELSGEKYIKAIDESLKETEPISFYKSLADFKDKFKKVEEHILKEKKATKLLIFIDDLDRCEPENVLNLITSIKLFFTYGEQSVYFCGLDKNAVNMAVKTKYKDVVKAEEYLEKVFDISFNMPKTYDIKKMLKPYFDNEIKAKKIPKLKSVDIIEEFFLAIGFTNPRHLKKVLNKYEILKAYKKLTASDVKNLIPNILDSDSKGNIFETIYCLYMIVLYEFHIDEFKAIENYDFKKTNYLNKFEKNYKEEYSTLVSALSIENYSNKSLKDIFNKNDENNFSKFLFLFSGNNPQALNFRQITNSKKIELFFLDNSLATNFCNFLNKYSQKIKAESVDSEYIIWNLFNMAKYLL